jgi:hypothetical protein
LGGKMTLLVVPGKGHAEIPEFFQSQPYLDFLLAEAQPVSLSPGVTRRVRGNRDPEKPVSDAGRDAAGRLIQGAKARVTSNPATTPRFSTGVPSAIP